MNNKLISIIIPTWNRVKDTERAVKSVLLQTYQNFEIIIADDGSTDETKDVFSNFSDPRVRYISIKHSGLPAVARNAALHEAHGDWVAFLDSDDEWLPNKLETQLSNLHTNPDIGLICSNAFVDKGIGSHNILFHEISVSSSLWAFSELLVQNIIITSSVLVKKSLIINSGGFLENSAYCAVEDYALWLSVALQTKIFYLNSPLVIYTDIGDSIRNEQSIKKYWMGMLKISDYLLEKYPEEIKTYAYALRNFRSSCLKNLITCFTDKDENGLIFFTCLKLLSNQPFQITNYKFVLKQIIQIL